MAKTVKVKLTDSSDWMEVEVANFYDPEKHHTVRLGANDKRTYTFIEMPDGKVYDKVKERWLSDAELEPEEKLNIFVGFDGKKDYININPLFDKKYTLTELPFESGSVANIQVEDCLQYIDDLVGVMNELHRVLSSNGSITITVPLACTSPAKIDPMKRREFGTDTFYFFVDHPKTAHFKIKPWSWIRQQVISENLKVQMRK